MHQTFVVLVTCLLISRITAAEEPPALPPAATEPVLGSAQGADAFAPQQLETLARIARVPRRVLVARLEESVELRTDARKALGANAERRASGKPRAIGGFALAGIGQIIVGIGFLKYTADSMADDFDFTTSTRDRRQSDQRRDGIVMLAGLVVMGVGAAIGVPGILSYARRGPDELEFADEVRAAGNPVPPGRAGLPPRFDSRPERREEPVPSAPALMFPIASLSF